MHTATADALDNYSSGTTVCAHELDDLVASSRAVVSFCNSEVLAEVNTRLALQPRHFGAARAASLQDMTSGCLLL